METRGNNLYTVSRSSRDCEWGFQGFGLQSPLRHAKGDGTMSIGTTIARLRKERGLTQADLAKAAKLSASAIAMYETDRRTPDAAAMTKLLAVLKVPREVLTEGEEYAAPEIAASSNDKPTGSKKSAAAASARAPRTGTAQPQTANTPQLALTREEARIILFLRMNPDAMTFFQSYITAGNQRRMQLEKTWKIINQFQN